MWHISHRGRNAVSASTVFMRDMGQIECCRHILKLFEVLNTKMAKSFMPKSFSWVARATISCHSYLAVGPSMEYKETVLVADFINDILLRSLNECSILLKDNLDVAIEELGAR